MEKLKKCSFCNCKATLYRNDMNHVVGVQCKNEKCGATVVFFQNGWNRVYNKKDEITILYNRRA